MKALPVEEGTYRGYGLGASVEARTKASWSMLVAGREAFTSDVCSSHFRVPLCSGVSHSRVPFPAIRERRPGSGSHSRQYWKVCVCADASGSGSQPEQELSAEGTFVLSSGNQRL